MKPFLKNLIFLTCLAMTIATVKLVAEESPRQHLGVDDNWRFYLGDPQDGAATSLDDSGWRTVTLPHDWSIEGKMDPKAPMGGDRWFSSGRHWVVSISFACSIRLERKTGSG